MDRLDLVDARRGAGRLRHEVGHLTLVQASKRQHRRLACHQCQRPTNLWRKASLGVAIGADDKQRSGAKVAHEELEQQERGGIGGMQVVEHHELWSLGRNRVQE